MARVYNFAAGPATLPVEVLQEAADEMLDYKGTGMSVMEMSHRSKAFKGIIEEAESDLRDLLSIPEEYTVLFMQGGASTQFAAIPMNLLNGGVADYMVTGSWSKKAFKEAKMYGTPNCIATSEDENFSYIPDVTQIKGTPDAKYLYICQNETITGTYFHELPKTDAVLVADMSSCFLSQPINVKDYGVIYAGAQKNVGPAGVVIAIIRKDLITEDVVENTPTMLRWTTHEANGSMYNTPPCYSIYICGKVFKWIKAQGGLEGMGKRNTEKAALLYDFLDSSKMFNSTVRACDRSIMNVPFVTGDADLDAKFIAEATEAGLKELKGHRSVGGMRASIYNAMTPEGVRKLVEFMTEFEAKNA